VTLIPWCSVVLLFHGGCLRAFTFFLKYQLQRRGAIVLEDGDVFARG
jgi:hypothetical protein